MRHPQAGFSSRRQNGIHFVGLLFPYSGLKATDIVAVLQGKSYTGSWL